MKIKSIHTIVIGVIGMVIGLWGGSYAVSELKGWMNFSSFVTSALFFFYSVVIVSYGIADWRVEKKYNTNFGEGNESN